MKAETYFKNIDEINRKYTLGRDGTIYTHYRNRIKSTIVTKQGYKFTTLHINNKCVGCTVHRIIALKYLDTYKDGLVVNHIDNDKMNNNVENLEWVTQKENVNHAIRIGAMTSIGEGHANHKLKEKDIILILKRRDITNLAMAKMLNVSKTLVGNIRRGEAWKHIPRSIEYFSK